MVTSPLSLPVYFAFKLTETPYTRATSACGSWVDTPPTEEGHVFFVGSSRPVRTEKMARTGAELRAKASAMQSVAQVPEFSADVDVDSGDAAPQPDTAAQQWAMGMQVVESCVETEETSRGTKYVGRVLGKLPEYTPAASAAE